MAAQILFYFLVHQALRASAGKGSMLPPKPRFCEVRHQNCPSSFNPQKIGCQQLTLSLDLLRESEVLNAGMRRASVLLAGQADSLLNLQFVKIQRIKGRQIARLSIGL